jgi:hypothetical protein
MISEDPERFRLRKFLDYVVQCNNVTNLKTINIIFNCILHIVDSVKLN